MLHIFHDLCPKIIIFMSLFSFSINDYSSVDSLILSEFHLKINFFIHFFCNTSSNTFSPPPCHFIHPTLRSLKVTLISQDQRFFNYSYLFFLSFLSLSLGFLSRILFQNIDSYRLIWFFLSIEFSLILWKIEATIFRKNNNI